MPRRLRRRASHEDGELGAAARGFFTELEIDADDSGSAPNHFGEPDNGDLGAIGDEFDASLTHPCAAEAEELHIGLRSKGRGQPCGVHLAGGLSRGDEDLVHG
jgi:hypothetical protein